MQDLQPWQDLYWQRRIKARVNESLQSILGSESCTDQWPPLHWSGARLRKIANDRAAYLAICPDINHINYNHENFNEEIEDDNFVISAC